MTDTTDVPDDVLKALRMQQKEYARRSTAEVDPVLRNRWAGISVGMFDVLEKLSPIIDRASRPPNAREAVLEEVDAIVREEWQAFVRTADVAPAATIAAILNRIRALSNATAASPAVEPVAVDAVLKRAGPMYPGKLIGNHINGDIYGDRKGRFRDGENVTTSRVQSIEGDIVRTGNSVYRVEWLPDNSRGDE